MAKSAELLMMKGLISELPAADQEKVKACADKLRALVAEYRDYGKVAIGLVVVELSDE